MAPITLTRQQLYDRAWTTPLDTLAKELGLSGRGLGKLCARHRVPVPPRGHWAKKAAGKRVSQPSLPAADSRTHQRIGFLGASVPAVANSGEPAVHPLIAFEQNAANRLTVPDDLPLTDPLLLKTQRLLLRRSKLEATGFTAIPAGGLRIHTSRPQHERAVRLLQALLTAFATRDFAVTTTADAGTRVTILDESLGFGIEEQTKAVEHRITFTEQKRIDQGFGYRPPQTDAVPSGDLTLLITNVHGVRHRWAEGARRLEDTLNVFLIGLVRAALGLKRQRAEAERIERERLEAERVRQEEGKRQAAAEHRWREEQARIERLDRLAAVWERHQRLRDVVTDLRATIGEVQSDSQLGTWLAWAAGYVERSDPLRRLRDRKHGTLTLYYHGYDHARVQQEGFGEPRVYGNEKVKAGVELTDRPPQRDSYQGALKLELAEDLVLPFEWPQESDWYWRVFRVPAALLNVTLGYAAQAQGGEEGASRDGAQG